jgi:putative transposase
MQEHEARFKIRRMCRILSVSPSGYYDWCERGESRRSREDKVLVSAIRRIHVANREQYGSVKTWHALNQQGIACGKHRVARLRRLHGIEAKRRRRHKVTTRSKHQHWIAPDRVNRCFQATQPNQVWAGDVTFIATRRGWLYLAILLDLYSRKVIGWSMSDRNDQTLVLGALEMALEHRQPKAGVIHHTDRGRLYAADRYRHVLETHAVLPSMGRKGDCYDNAVSESFFSTLKNELTHDRRYDNRDQARMEIFDYIEIFYNRQRLHQTLGYKTPQEYERVDVHL